MTEAKLWKDHFRPYILKDDPKAFCRRIENAVGTGDPDCYVISKGKVCFYELKCKSTTKDDFIYPHYQPMQLAIMKRMERAWGKVFVVLYVKNQGIFVLPPCECYPDLITYDYCIAFIPLKGEKK